MNLRDDTETALEKHVIDTGRLDKTVWNTFAERIQDPGPMKGHIVQGEFLADKDRALHDTALAKAGLELFKLRDNIERIKNFYPAAASEPKRKVWKNRKMHRRKAWPRIFKKSSTWC